MKKLALALFMVLIVANMSLGADFLELCKSGTAQEVAAAIKNGANANAKDENGTTALMMAVNLNSETEVASVLLKNGADINAVDDYGWTAWMAAAAGCLNPEVISVLLNNGANINDIDENGTTALMTAVVSSNPAMIPVLLKHGADASIKDNEGKRAIDYASENKKLKNTDAYRQLLAASNAGTK